MTKVQSSKPVINILFFIFDGNLDIKIHTERIVIT